MVELRERVLKLLRAARDPRGLAYHEIAEQVGGERRDRHRVRTLLVDLVDDGVLERSEGARYRPVGWIPTSPEGPRPAAPGTTVGRLRVHPAGYGFVEREDQGDDVFVPARHRGAALDGDRVALATWGGHQGTEGRVVEILARGRARLTGTLRAGGRVLLLEPDDPRILGSVVITGFPAGAHPDQVVVAEITRYPEVADGDFEARVVRVLGAPAITCRFSPSTRSPPATSTTRSASRMGRGRGSIGCGSPSPTSPTTSVRGAPSTRRPSAAGSRSTCRIGPSRCSPRPSPPTSAR